MPGRITAEPRTAASVASPAAAGCWLSWCTYDQSCSRCTGISSGASASSVGGVPPCTALTSVACTNLRHGCATPGRGAHSKPGTSSALNNSYAAPRAISSAGWTRPSYVTCSPVPLA